MLRHLSAKTHVITYIICTYDVIRYIHHVKLLLHTAHVMLCTASLTLEAEIKEVGEQFFNFF